MAIEKPEFDRSGTYFIERKSWSMAAFRSGLRQLQWLQLGASAWMAHSKLSKVWGDPPLTVTDRVLS
jgi:hypothetical protein